MRFATRVNSFRHIGSGPFDRFGRILDIPGITDLELNYPEHFEGTSVREVDAFVKARGKRCSGCAVRFRHDFKDGEFSAKENRAKAIVLAKETADVVRDLGGTCLSLWLAYDGFDYPFQIDYARAWSAIVDSIREIASYAPDLQVSFEFKPRDPRSFSMVPNTGFTLSLINQIGASNVGMTLDYCHSLMAAENPAMALAIAAEHGRLFGVHLNDGYGLGDDGLFFGSVNQLRALEFMYYLKKYRYDGLVYFDTFPIREDPVEETKMNLWMFSTLSSRIDELGLERIGEIIRDSSGFESKKAILELLIGTRKF
jgi:xylose isomerase